MKPVPLLVLLAGVAIALAGFSWLWGGLDIVQVERGWSAVIAGATLLSAGLVICALAGVIWRLEQIATRLAPAGLDRSKAVSPMVPSTVRPVIPTRTAETPFPKQPSPPTKVSPPERPPREMVPPLAVPATEAIPEGQRAVVGRHVSGDATYIMYADGSVEAQTPDGVVTFASLEALRAHAEAREAEQARA